MEKITAKDKYCINPNLCLHCGKIVPYKKNRGTFCNIICSNRYRNGLRNYEKSKIYTINWKEVQDKHNKGTLLSKIPNEFNFSYSTLNKAIKLGLLKTINTDVHKDKRRESLSISLKKSHEEGRHIGWKHINNNIKRSYPEEFFMKILNKNGITDRYTVIEKMPFHKYTLDFVITELKLNIEIDGQQHFRTEKAILHDIKRNDFLINNGWLVYRIAWINLKNNTNHEVNNLLSYLSEENKKSVFYDFSEIISKTYKNKYGSRKDYRDAQKQQQIEINIPKIKLVLNSNIDFSRQGWSKKVSVLINILPQKVKAWMKKYMLEFYESICFKKIDRNGLSRIRKFGCKNDYNKELNRRARLINDERILMIKENNINIFEKGVCEKLTVLFGVKKNQVYRWIRKNKKAFIN